jgi:ATP-binding cassette subfamily B protein
MEPLGAPDEPGAPPREETPESPSKGVALAFSGVSVHAGGRTILEGIDLTVAPGEHVAIVGPSGAGKSSLVGMLLGWHGPSAGQLLADGAPCHGESGWRLRRETVWVDPGVQLWNRSLLENLRYGSPDDSFARLSPAVEEARLHGLIERLPDGLETSLGEGGALVSGGEGQRVRLARAIVRDRARLVILDEPFRGLDRVQRHELLSTARKLWNEATVLCISHDVGETRAFDRVIVLEGGRIVEDGRPAELAARPGSRYAAMLESEEVVIRTLRSSAVWRRLRVEHGHLVEDGANAPR